MQCTLLDMQELKRALLLSIGPYLHGSCSVGTACPNYNNSGVENKGTQDECETMFIVVYNQHDKCLNLKTPS